MLYIYKIFGKLSIVFYIFMYIINYGIYVNMVVCIVIFLKL